MEIIMNETKLLQLKHIENYVFTYKNLFFGMIIDENIFPSNTQR